MKWLREFFNRKEKEGKPEQLIDKKEQALYRIGREQFKKLTEKGLTIPIFTL